jgi:hypothetical protein
MLCSQYEWYVLTLVDEEPVECRVVAVIVDQSFISLGDSFFRGK